MSIDERRSILANTIAEFHRGVVSARDITYSGDLPKLAQDLGVSVSTVKRDLRALTETGVFSTSDLGWGHWACTRWKIVDETAVSS